MKKNINMRKMKWFVIGVVMLCLLSGVLWESLLQRTLQEYQVEGAGVMDVLAVNAHMKDAVVLESEEDFQSVLGALNGIQKRLWKREDINIALMMEMVICLKIKMERL